jgi:hypothetical protein
LSFPRKREPDEEQEADIKRRGGERVSQEQLMKVAKQGFSSKYKEVCLSE